MEKSNKRGKIPQSDWPLIMARYDAGETLASIARTYDCSPPAISYVVSRSRTRQPEAGVAAPAAIPPEPQLIKASPADAAVAARPAAAQVPAPPDEPAPVAPLAAAETLRAAAAGSNGLRNGEVPRDGNGLGRSAGNGAPPNVPRPAPPWQRPTPPINGEQRRTLHLSLGAPHINGGARPAEPPTERSDTANRDHQPAANIVDRHANGGSGPPAVVDGEPLRRADAAPRGDSDGANRHAPSGAFIDRELRIRVAGDIDAFLGAFDAALADDTLDNRAALREATDRLLRAGARTRIELERLEARMPLAVRDAGRANPSWRNR